MVAFAATVALAGGVVPGNLKENAKVDQNGAFNFSIPIEVPPGIAGMQPELSLAYSSQQQNGIVGMGWSLTGLPSVQRTKRIRAIDDVNGTIAYDANDKFSYQGQRLIVTAGVYAADGSVYHSEIESWQLVSARGVAGSGPSSFIVKTRDGRTLEQGNTADSRVLAAGRSDVRAWNVNRVTDLNGNSMDITYSDDPLNTGSPDRHGYPVQIAYTSNGSTAANRFVRFKYEARDDVERTFIGGSEVRLSVRLSRIQTFVAGAMVSDYRLTYESSNATGRSRMLAVNRFESDATTATSLAPASFSYANGALAFAGKQNWLNGAFSKSQGWDGVQNPFTLADVNGDGFLDIVGFKNGVQVALGGSAGFQTPTRWINDFSGDQGWNSSTRRLLADVNGDGLADIVGISGKGVEVAISSGAAFTKSATVFPYFGSSQGWTQNMPVWLIDVNGDKVMDIVGVKNGSAWVAVGQGSGTFATPTVWLQNFGQSGANYLSADLNGDGNADLMVVANDQSIRVALSTGTSFETGSWRNQAFKGLCGTQPVTSQTPLMVADVNGDGLTDVVAFCDAVYVTLSSGQGFQPAEKWNTTFAGPTWSAGNQRMLTDLNGDGLADLVAVTSSGVIAAISNGHAFLDGKWNQASLPWGLSGGGSSTITTRLLGDANGDGLMDMVGIGDTNVYVGLSAGAVPDVMVGAVRSAGATYTVTYAPLSDKTVYQETGPAAKKSALAQYQNFQPFSSQSAIPNFRSASKLGGFYHVVKTLQIADNSAVGDTAFNYAHRIQYENGGVDLNGRGWAGFAKVTTDSQAGGKRLVNTYLQDFPFIGNLTESTTVDRLQMPNCSGSPVPHSGQKLAYVPVQTAVSTSPQATPVYFVARTDRQVVAYQDCAVARRLGTHYDYDSYGNVAMVTRQNAVDANGHALDPSKNVYTLHQYFNDPVNWRFGFLLFSKVSSSSASAKIGQFNPGTDFSLSAMTYDAKLNLATRGKWDNGNSRFLSDSYQYDGYGNRTVTTQPSTAVVSVSYDPLFHAYPLSKSVTPAPGKTLGWTYGYDPRFGKLSVSVDPNNVTKAHCFDSFGRVIASQGPYPDNRTTGSFDASCVSSLATGAPAAANLLTIQQRSYQTSGGLPAVTTTALAVWPQSSERTTLQSTQYMDGLWRNSKVVKTNPGERMLVASQTAYSEHNKISRSAVPYFVGDPVRYIVNKRDVQGRPIETDTPWGADGVSISTKSYTATATGSTVQMTSAAGTAYANTQMLAYGYFADKPRLLSMTTQGVTTATTFGYDVLGRRVSAAAPVSQDGSRPSYAYSYDSLNRIVSKTEPTRGNITVTYDTAGNLASRKQSGGTFNYTYDLIGRRLGVLDSAGQARGYVFDNPQVPFGMNRKDAAQVLNADKSLDSSYAYAYDAYGKPAQVTMNLPAAGKSYVSTSSVDPVGHLVRLGNPDGSVVQRGFNGTRLASVSIAGGAGATFSDYSAAGTPRRITYGNGVTANYLLNIDESPAQLTITDPAGKVLISRAFTWDQLGRLQTVTDLTTTPATVLQQYQYAGLRLASATNGANVTNFAYDDTGNMTGYDGAAYTYSGTQAISASGGAAFKAAYGPMGNMLDLAPQGQDPLAFTYDVRNQLVAVRKGKDAAGASYKYDDQGRRILAVAPDGSQTVYVSPWYMDVIAKGASSPIRVLSARGVPFAQWGATTGDPSQYYLHTDHQRSVFMTSSAKGQSLATFSYSPMGKLQASPAALPRFLYTAKELDPYSGIYWVNSRGYHPAYGRFLKPDSQLGGPLLRPDALNDNAYVLNNPASYLDPTGHSALGVAGGVCWVVSAGFGITAAADADLAKPMGITAGSVGAVCGILNALDSYLTPAAQAPVAAAVGGAPGGGLGGGALGGGGGGLGAVGAGDGAAAVNGGAAVGGGDAAVAGADGLAPMALPGAANVDGALAVAGDGVVGGDAAAPVVASLSQVAAVDALPAANAGVIGSVEGAAIPDMIVASGVAESAEAASAVTATATVSTSTAVGSTVALGSAAAEATIGGAAAAATAGSVAAEATAGEAVLEVLPVLVLAL
ncbi:FG-GAP-like repeat-containing protein [Polaromonas sp.]|uniref:FG-GAP-like repeat-containing protein n=1 Tax=Polaromonas sp. TaxID=1869339 RepID=UPI003265F56C